MSVYEQLTYRLGFIDTVVGVLTLALTTVGIALAYNGLKTWKDQISGETKHKQALKMMVKIYELRDAVLGVIPYVEKWLSFDEHGLSDVAHYEEYGEGSTGFTKRKNYVRRHAQDLVAFSREAEAIWGVEIMNAIYQYIDFIASYMKSSNTLITYYIERLQDITERDFEEEITEEEFQMARSNLNSSEFKQGLDESVQNLRKELAPFIELSK